MSSSSSNKETALSPDNENSNLTKIAAATTNKIDRHLARIVAGNAGLLEFILLYFYCSIINQIQLLCFRKFTCTS